jgi:parvulin-like peptidyl-prolyl isomerase
VKPAAGEYVALEHAEAPAVGVGGPLPPASGKPAMTREEGAVEPFVPARVVAQVGSEVILAGDVLGPINQVLEQYADQLSPEQLDRQREMMLRQQLPVLVETKMLYLAFLRGIPADKQKEALPKIWEQIQKKFEEDELPKLLKQHKAETAAQLDAKLRQYGWSLAKQTRFFGERNLGIAGAFQKIEREPEVTHDEMLAYYEEHAEEYAVVSAARWEQLTARFDAFPSRDAAYDAIAQMGNEVALGGAPLWAVAKRSSSGFTAQDGGQNDWTNQGSLASEALDQALFELPPGELSRIIEDTNGYHVVRVLERREAGRKPFTDAQVEIKKKIQEEKRKVAFKKYLAELKREIPVWTVYDDQPAVPAAESSAD